MTSCPEFEAAVTALADDSLPPAERAGVEEHLAHCVRCRGLLIDVRRLLSAARQLGPMAPPDRVWAAISVRLPLPGATQPGRQTWRPRHWLQIAAAALIVAAGLYLVRRESPVESELIVEDGTSLEVVANELTLAIHHYDNAIAELDRVLDRTDVDPEVTNAIHSSLGLVDRAIADRRLAIARRPASVAAQTELIDALQQKFIVLETTMRLIRDTQEGSSEPMPAPGKIRGKS